MTGVWHDMQHGLRMLGRSPLVTAAVVFALAASIGANTVLFSVVDEAMLRPLPYPQARRLVTVWESWLDKGFSRLPVLPVDFLELQTQVGLFDELAAFKSAAFNLAGTDEPERLRAARVTPSFFAALGVDPAIGRRFVPEDDSPNAERVVLLADGVWRRRFGADTAVVGRRIRLDGVSHTIVGIMPREFRFALDWSLSGLTLPAVDLWVPLALTPDEQNAGFDLMVVGRLRHEVSVAMARTRLEAIAEALERRDPKRKGIGLAVVPLQDVIVGDLRGGLMTMWVAIGLVLLMACANAASLLLAKASSRRRATAIRAALGASRLRLARQWLVEGLLLALLAGGAGLAAAVWTTDLIIGLGPPVVRSLAHGTINARVLVFTGGISLLAGMAFSVVPMLELAKSTPSIILRTGTQVGVRSHTRVWHVLVVCETAMALMLTTGATLAARSLERLLAVDPGFVTEGVSTARVSLPLARYQDGRQQIAFFDMLLERLTARPNVRLAGATSALPFEPASEMFFTIDGRTVANWQETPVATSRSVSPDYFRVMGIPLRRGRSFTVHDRERAEPIVIIDETLAERYWPGENPIGRRIKEGSPQSQQPWLRVVGVVGQVRQHGLAADAKPGIYKVYCEAPRRQMTLVAQTGSGTAAFGILVRQVVRELDRDQPVDQIRSMTEVVEERLAPRRFSLGVLSVLSGLALVLACVGVYGITSFTVRQRKPELAVRMALGASQSAVRRLILRDTLRDALVGTVLGGAGAVALARTLANQLYGMTGADPVGVGLSALVLACVSAVATWLPAARAGRIDPAAVLRHQ